MLITALNELQKAVDAGSWNPKIGELWQGADVIVAPELTSELEEWEASDQEISEPAPFGPAHNILVISEQAEIISSMMYELKDIFSGYINRMNPRIFYGRLGLRAKFYTEHRDDPGVLSEMIAEARVMAHQLEGQYYFSYAADMNETRMARLCPNVEPINKARVYDYRFLINSSGVATIEPYKGAYVEGLLWSVFPEDLEVLDRYHGSTEGSAEQIDVAVSSLETVESDGSLLYQQGTALAYVSTDTAPGSPDEDYLGSIVRQAQRFGLDDDYINELRSWQSFHLE